MGYLHRLKVDSVEVRVSDRAREALQQPGDTLGMYLTRHCHGDWGEADDLTKKENEQALKGRTGEVISLFTTTAGARLCFVTEIQKERTSVLLAEEVLEHDP
jgi:hypothetical protein